MAWARLCIRGRRVAVNLGALTFAAVCVQGGAGHALAPGWRCGYAVFS